MALTFTTDIELYLHSFRSLGLPGAGNYQLVLSCYYIKRGTKIFAEPIYYGTYNTKQASKKKKPEYLLGKIIPEENKIRLNSVKVGYENMTYFLRDVCKFQLNVKAKNTLLVKEIYLMCDLVAYSSFSDGEIIKSSEFKISIENYAAIEYIPIIFENFWVCFMEGVLSVSPIGYKINSWEKNDLIKAIFWEKKNQNISHEDILHKKKQLFDILFSTIKEINEIFVLVSKSSIESKENIQESDAQDYEIILQEILECLNDMSSACNEGFRQFQATLLQSPGNIINILKSKYLLNFQEFITSRTIKKFELNFDFDIPEEAVRLAKDIENLRKNSIEFRNRIIDQSCWKLNVIIIEHSLIITPTHYLKQEHLHVLIFVHGLGASSADMAKLSNMVTMAYPYIEIKHFDLGADKTFDDIGQIGAKLASELIDFFENSYFTDEIKISFVGHSLGGIFIRAALPYLGSYQAKFHSYISLSAPHLGVAEHQSLISTGFKLIRAWNKSKSLEQLSLKDSKSIENTYFYQLSQAEGLGWFNFVVLISSRQDLYCPFHSARIEIPLNGQKKYGEMVRNIVGRIDDIRKIIKIEIDFVKEASFNEFIGRRAHIKFIEDEDFIYSLIYNYHYLFE
ncbi:unnamed protein product [Blepharisma stoltei]|uniref:DUF676 domain-containing protein n=1 Tax=Blepharisma stoltei TaxID=1481888 RepID=A0AAU9JNF8_9CILI|nr:unnamed protein product [Blepharisma stoltei]